MAVETLAAAVGKAVVTRAVSDWLGHASAKGTRDKTLAQLIRTRFTDKFVQRDLNRQIQSMVDDVTRRLTPFIAIEFKAITKEQKTSISAMIVDVFTSSELSDELLFDAHSWRRRDGVLSPCARGVM